VEHVEAGLEGAPGDQGRVEDLLGGRGEFLYPIEALGFE
jgi:hypothetical protein